MSYYRNLCGVILDAMLICQRVEDGFLGRFVVLHDGRQSDKSAACRHASMKTGKHVSWHVVLLAIFEKTLILIWSMMIVLANSKGGVEKSTLAVHLIGWLHERGNPVTLADCDMQRSSSEWVREETPEVKSVRLASPDELLNGLPSLNAEADYVVADGPDGNTETSRALLLRADLALVPCKSSMLEVRAITQATDLLRQAQDIRAMGFSRRRSSSVWSGRTTG
jgi:cellulose biosynthesis protein BcsQ